MNRMVDEIGRGKKSLIFFLFIYLSTPFFSFAAENEELPLDPSILIYSSTHGPVSYVKEFEGVLTVNITAFEQITQIWLNGELHRSPQTSRVALDLPFNLSGTPFVFKIQAITSNGINQKIFTIHHGTKPKPKSSPFQLIGIFGVTSTDNLNNETLSSDKDSALKAALTLVPSYRISYNTNTDILIKGIWLRDKYTKDEFAGKEIAFSRLSSQWIMKKTQLGEITAELGGSDIRTDNSNILVSEEHSKTEIYLSGKIKQKLRPKMNWNIGLRLKSKDSIPEPLNANYDADAIELKLNAGLKGEIVDIKVALKSGYTINEAKGKYLDYSSLNFSIKESITIGDWTPSLKHYRKDRNMANPDPDKDNLTPYYSTHTVVLKLKYNLGSNLIFSLDAKEKKQSSNIEDYNYTQNTMTFAATYIF